MTDEMLDEIKSRHARAPRGPWRGDRIDGSVKYDVLDADGNTVIHGCNGNEDPRFGIYEPTECYDSPTEAFILGAWSDIATLLAEVARLRAGCAK